MRSTMILISGIMGFLLANATNAASADTPGEWTFAKPNSTYGEFWRAQIACVKTSRKRQVQANWKDGAWSPLDCEVLDTTHFLSCMNDKGYGPDADGYRTDWKVMAGKCSRALPRDWTIRTH